MSEFKGTMEEWKLDGDIIYADDYFQTHIAIIPSSYDVEIREANALLISKAPDMLEFLQSIVSDYENGLIEDIEHVAIRAEQLIKSATEG